MPSLVTDRRARPPRLALVMTIGLLALADHRPAFADAQRSSVCYGTRSRGSIEHSLRLPRTGPNFRAYSTLGWTLGRTHVHDRVHEVVLESYRRLEERAPELRFVYGETGWPRGGKFRPHRTHQNGLSVDFMVPMRNAAGEVVELPTSLGNKFGYGHEFDDAGRSGDLKIDFEALAEHLWSLSQTAKSRRVGIRKVILAPALRKKLKSTRRWPQIRKLPFSRKPVWVRHDDHYHVDFGVKCRSTPRPGRHE